MATVARMCSVVSSVKSSSVAARSMATGTTKWFNVTKGYGFISPDDKTQPDLFVHQSAIQSTGFRFLKEGERVNYDMQATERGSSASNVTTEEGKPFDRLQEPRSEAPRAPRAPGSGMGRERKQKPLA